ncbi:hypothetical protein CEK26_001276 [Fusarium fujikuroi]|nr:hypothetical protein CEK27_001276 [Fusarium fujikuroi]QGI76363.1 hypothetical protein CEK25_001269 [Fusarium fujikuroi]QGI90061.1 hypothetical protein CEK26_001276 [Fusarium fujikuroi]
MPKDYTTKSSGTNSQVRTVIYTPNCVTANISGQPLLRSRLRDGSYYYSNPNESTYYNDGQGSSTYTSPSDYTHSSDSGKK